MSDLFMGGTCNDSLWRDKLKPLLKIKYFDPVVKDWNEEAQKEEIRQRDTCNYCLYMITPNMAGVYSVAEVIEDSIKRPEKTIYTFITKDSKVDTSSDSTKVDFTTFDSKMIKSLDAVGKMVERNGGKYISNTNENDIYKAIADYVNGDE